MTLHRFSPQLNLNGGHTLERTAMMRFAHHKRLGVRFCPECISESTKWNILWQIRMVTTCLKHESLLVERCRDCDAPISVQTLRSGRCKCSAAIVQHASRDIPIGNRGLLAQNTIQDLLLGTQPSADGLAMPIWFASLDFLQRWMSSFPSGSLSADGITTATEPEVRRKLWEPVEIDYVHYTIATEILRQGQLGFSQLCHQWLDVKQSYRKWATGFHQDFARLHQLLGEFPNSVFPHLHEWLAEFVAREWSGGYPTRVQRVEKVTAQERIPLDRAAKMLHCRTHNVVLMVKNGLLHGGLLPLSVDGTVRGLVTIESVERALMRRMDAIPLQLAATVTGLGPWLLRQLALSGVLVADRGPMADGTEEILVHRSRLVALMEALTSRSCAATPDMIPLGQLDLDAATDLIRDILLGQRVAHVRMTQGQIGEVLVGKWTRDIALGADSHSDELPLVRASNALGITESLMKALTTRGLLDYVDGMVRGCNHFKHICCWEHEAGRILGISTISLRRWSTWGRVSPAYVIGRCRLYQLVDLLPFAPRNRCTVKEAGQLLGCHPQDIRRYHIACGKLKPLGGPGVDAGRETILCLRDVLALAKEQPPIIYRGEGCSETKVNAEHMITTQEAARLLGLSVGQFQARHRRNDGLVPGGRQSGGRQSLFYREDVERFLR